jgi:hypothetical protein
MSLEVAREWYHVAQRAVDTLPKEDKEQGTQHRRWKDQLTRVSAIVVAHKVSSMAQWQWMVQSRRTTMETPTDSGTDTTCTG